MSQSNLSAEIQEKITEYGNLMTDLLTGKDLKYETMGVIVVPNSYKEKIERVFRLFKELCERQDNTTFCVFIDGRFENMKASEYLSNRLDYINGKIKNNRLQLEFSWRMIIVLIFMSFGSVWGVLMWDCLLSKKENIIKKIIKFLGYLIVETACVFILSFFIASLFLAPPIEVMLFFLVLELFFSMVNLFFSIRFFNKKKLNSCQEFRDKYREMENFIQSYRNAAQNIQDIPQNIQQDDVKSNAETDISENDRQKNNQLENSGWIPALNNDEFIIVFNNDKNDLI